jgi:hypothetical protein
MVYLNVNSTLPGTNIAPDALFGAMTPDETARSIDGADSAMPRGRVPRGPLAG